MAHYVHLNISALNAKCYVQDLLSRGKGALDNAYGNMGIVVSYKKIYKDFP